MKVPACIILAVALCATASAQTDQPEAVKKCLIVKHKGTIGRRLMFTALIGVPIAPGSKYDYVDSINLAAQKLAFSGKDLQKIQTDGVHVIVLNNKYTSTDLQDARKACGGFSE